MIKKDIVWNKFIKYAIMFKKYIFMKFWKWNAYLWKMIITLFGFNMLLIFGLDIISLLNKLLKLKLNK
jgi:hypothetical protein